MIAGILKYIKLIMVLIVSLFMIYSSMMKFVDYPGMSDSFAIWGYSKSIMYFIGIVELILGCAIFIKQTRLYAIIGLVILMTGALYTHISNYEYDQLTSAIMILTLSILIFLLEFFESRGKIK